MQQDGVAVQRLVYDNEVRFGVVMYGGVSLAIYINGVANELYELCCATPKVGGVAPATADSTREVYRKLSWLRGNRALAARYLAHARDKSLPARFTPATPHPASSAANACASSSTSSPARRPAASTASSWPRRWPTARTSHR